MRIEQRLPAILRFAAAMRHPDGEIALFADAAIGIAPEPGALLGYARRLGLDAPEFASGTFPETGYHVFRSGDSPCSWTPARSVPTTCPHTRTATSSPSS